MTERPIDWYKHKGTGLQVQALEVNPETIDRLANWTQGQIVEEINPISKSTQEGLNIRKAKSQLKRASRGHFVIGVNGNFYIVGPEGFHEAYEPFQITEQPASRALEEYEVSPLSDPFEGMTRFDSGPRP